MSISCGRRSSHHRASGGSSSDDDQVKKRFLGNIILKPLDESVRSGLINKTKTGNNTISFFEIVDGQQRLTTILILWSVIGHQLKAFNEPVCTTIRSMFEIDLRGTSKYYPLITNTRQDMTKLLHLLITVGMAETDMENINAEEDIDLPLLDLTGSAEVVNCDNNEVFDMSDNEVKMLREKADNRRNLNAKVKLRTAYQFFREKLEYLKEKSRENYEDVLLELDTLIREGLRFTCYIQDVHVNVIETFMGINDRGKSLNALENTKSLLIGFADKMPSDDPEYDIVPKIENIWDFILDSLGDANLIKTKDEENFLFAVWRAFGSGASTGERSLFASIHEEFERKLQLLIESKFSQDNSHTTRAKQPETVDILIDNAVESDSDEEEEAERRYDYRAFGDYVLTFLYFLKHAITIFCWLKGKRNDHIHTILIFGEKYAAELEYMQASLRVCPFFDRSISLIMSAHFHCIFYEKHKYTYRSEEYAQAFCRFLKLLKCHLLFSSISLVTDVRHLDDYAKTFCFDRQLKNGKSITLDEMYQHFVENHLDWNSDDLHRFVRQEYANTATRKTTEPAMQLIILEHKIKSELQNEQEDKNEKQLELFRRYVGRRTKLGYNRIKSKTKPGYLSLGNRYITGTGVPKTSFEEREKEMIQELRENFTCFKTLHEERDEVKETVQGARKRKRRRISLCLTDDN